MACRYRTVPVRGAILYFVIADLAAIDPMYQHSLAYFMQLFTHCIEASARALDLETRLNTLLTFVTNFVFSTVSSGLLRLICTHSQQPPSSTRAPATVLLTFPKTLLCVMVTVRPLASAKRFVFTAVRPGLSHGASTWPAPSAWPFKKQWCLSWRCNFQHFSCSIRLHLTRDHPSAVCAMKASAPDW